MAAKGPTTIHDKAEGASFTRYALTVAPDTTLDEVLVPEFWAHIGKNMRPWDEWSILWQDRTRRANVVVLSAGNGYAKVKLLADYNLAEAGEADAADEAETDLIVKWDSPQTRYAVIRKADRVKLQAGFDSKEDAAVFIANYRRAA